MNLVDTADSLEIVLGGAVAANQLQVSVEYVEVTASGFTPGHQDAQTNNTTTVTILSAPGAASTYRLVHQISVYQKDTAEAKVTVKFDNSGTERELVTCTLSPGDTLTWSLEKGWQVHRAVASGREQDEATDTQRGTIEIATGGDMREQSNNESAATAGRVPFHPGTANCWGKAAGTGLTLNASFNVTGITDTGTGRLGVTIATDMAQAGYPILCTLLRSTTSLLVGSVEDNNIRLNSQTVTAFEVESYDHTVTTMLAQDPGSYFWLCYGYWL